MPTTYTGSATGTETNDTAPEPEKVPVINMPVTGELLTISSAFSAIKNLANHIAYVLAMKAKASDWAKWIFAFRTSGGHKRLLVDHIGLPMGRIQSWREGWDRGGTPAIGGNMSAPLSLVGHPVKFTSQVKADLYNAGVAISHAGNTTDSPNLAAAQGYLATAGTNLQNLNTSIEELTRQDRWNVYCKQTTGTSSVEIIAPDAVSSSRFRYVTLKAGNTAEDFAAIFAQADVSYSDDLSFAVEWEVKLEAANLSTLTAVMGFALEAGDPPLKTSSPPTHFVVFRLVPGGGNWFVSHNGGASVTDVDTTVAASTAITRMRIEFHGATVADNTTRAIRCYIDGTLRATITTNIPSSSQRPCIHFSLRNSSGGSSGLSNPLNIGPVRFGSNIYPSDVV